MHAIFISIKILSQNLIANIFKLFIVCFVFLFLNKYSCRWWNNKQYYNICIIYFFCYRIYSDLEFFLLKFHSNKFKVQCFELQSNNLSNTWIVKKRRHYIRLQTITITYYLHWVLVKHLAQFSLGCSVSFIMKNPHYFKTYGK